MSQEWQATATPVCRFPRRVSAVAAPPSAGSRQIDRLNPGWALVDELLDPPPECLAQSASSRTSIHRRRRSLRCGNDRGRYTASQMDEEKKEPAKRVLIGHFSADTDVDDIVDAILASVPPDERPAEDRPNRMARK
jgi:hypothetical protein